MTLEHGDIWSVFKKTGLFLFTANGDVNSREELVMGRGMALEVKDRCPGVALWFGMRSKANPGWCLLIYSPKPSYGGPIQPIGAFRVKYHWYEPANLALIMKATTELVTHAPEYDRIDLNFPGIGNGRLQRADVLPIVSALPDNVHIWER